MCPIGHEKHRHVEHPVFTVTVSCAASPVTFSSPRTSVTFVFHAKRIFSLARRVLA